MSLPEWSLILGLGMSVILAVGPWMFMVHAKLAVIVSKSADLCDKLEQIAADQRALNETASEHSSRLNAHDIQLRHIAEQR